MRRSARRLRLNWGKRRVLRPYRPLLSAAADPDPGVREECRQVLGPVERPAAVTMLLTTLQDPVENVREQSIIALVSLYLDREAEFIVTKVSKKVYKTVNPFSDQIGKDPSVIEAYIKVPRSVIDGIAAHLVDPSTIFAWIRPGLSVSCEASLRSPKC